MDDVDVVPQQGASVVKVASSVLPDLTSMIVYRLLTVSQGRR